MHHPQASQLRALMAWIAQQTGAKYGVLTEGSNSAGAWLAGAVPHRLPAGQRDTASGLNAAEMVKQPRAAYVLMGIEPECDMADSAVSLNALHQAKCVVALTAFTNQQMLEYADILLPIGAFTESAGTFVNLAGQWQTFKGASKPYGESRPAWKVLRVLGNLFGLSHFEYMDQTEVLTEMQNLCQNSAHPYLDDVIPLRFERVSYSQPIRIAETPIYATDYLLRRAEPLQKTPDAQVNAIRIHPELGNKLHVHAGETICATQNNHNIYLPVHWDENLPVHAVMLPCGIQDTIGMGPSFAPITLKKGKG